ncbi:MULTISPECIES: cytochrome c biogenesis heme-transporting ATPase CcmA [Achromobacter]|jgi:heme exporter protein A|uniref:Cytochrome c biogenesis heme-transporting ATPase CcmA n=1 Tax=Alcaligenes xylosoxydans xylosoxydans TaxID=85698 RepID=A0A9W5AFD7_ALCXX|nr:MULTISPECIES: cytochrome c biogenesis heme-transporting ATPase CcmA [Achromobacter]AUZ19993.1 cytochrome c biogenesis heme-transporting ATPase CcmA [Achromobacter xylosoxidans]AXA77240.1 cytochrome c biogenesis heme-transporting ATPase CcmA [Achromobacter xylosoxidans]EFV86879.1 heme ABC exporter [Achromobacter xylosoxidans C54]KAA5924469.1 cytochrome c biogenesis heme-transporting ATPase CcmA [Achromobacter xylosoxidans]KOQ20369.1 heme ABC transporter ATP-binding protein [Achromobacter xyl
MLEAEGLTCSKGTRLLFEDVSFQLRAGQLLRVTAPNGHGKTSLLRILCGLARADAGTVCWRGADIHRLGPAYRQHLLYLGHADALADSLTPLENLRFLCQAQADAVSTAACRDALCRMDLAALLDLPARVLSRGQRRRVMLARLSLRPARPLWILDEPFNLLDAATVAALTRTLASHCDNGGRVLLTTHQEVAFDRPVRTLDLGPHTP